MDNPFLIKPVTREVAQAALARFASQHAADYAARRNFDLGPTERSNVSMLSPYLRHRLISEDEAVRSVLAANGERAAAKFVEEVFWRAYFKGWLEQHPSVWHTYLEAVGRGEVGELAAHRGDDGALRERFAAAVEGRTGVACFDFWARELVATGYLHNHARMWFASIWIFTLKLPWQLGADFFLRHLLDGDPASNTLSWRWVGGLHTRGKTYLAGAENIERFTNGRFPATRGLAGAAVALREEREAVFEALRPAAGAGDVGSFRDCVMLVTEEDCSSEGLLGGLRPVKVVGVALAEARSPLGVAAPVARFAKGAVEDAVRRAGVQFNCPGEIVGEAGGLGAALVAACRRGGVERVVSAYAPVGPVATLLEDTAAVLGRSGIQMHLVRRRFDDLVWPHASRGYFRLKARIPELVQSLGLAAED